MAEMTYGELRRTSKRVEEETPVKDFELALSELLQMYRHRMPKDDALVALSRQSDLVREDGGWVEPGPSNAEDEPHEGETDGDSPAAA